MVYQGINQKLPSYLMGQAWVINAVNNALWDIYSYEWRYWSFMYSKKEVTPADLALSTTIDLEKPILRIFIIEDNTERIQKFEVVKIDTTLTEGQCYYKQHTNEIKIFDNTYVSNGTNGWYNIHYVHTFNRIGYLDEIPLPDLFLGALYNRTLAYLYPPYAQYGDNKQQTSYNDWDKQMQNLTKIDAFQLQNITGNIK